MDCPSFAISRDMNEAKELCQMLAMRVDAQAPCVRCAIRHGALAHGPSKSVRTGNVSILCWHILFYT